MAGAKTIYTRTGIPLASIRTAAVRSWLLNDIGEAVFSIATSDPKCTKSILEYGNYIVIEHDTLPDWVGIIDTPRTWHPGYLDVYAYDPAFLLQYRYPPIGTIIKGTAGEKFIKLLEFANAQGDTLLRTGEVYTSGIPSEEKFNDSIFSHLQSMANNNGNDWTFNPVRDSSGNLTIKMNWLARAGATTQIELVQGKNIMHGDTPLDESGELVSSVEAVSDIDAGVEGMVTASYSEIMPYGVRIKRVVYDGASGAAALQTFAEQTVKKQKNPSLATPLTIIDDGRTFENTKLGNVMTYRYSTIGFDGEGFGLSNAVRIEGFRFDEQNSTCELFTGVP